MTKEQFEQRLQELIHEEDLSLANLNAIGGAKREVMFWLDKMDKENKKEGE